MGVADAPGVVNTIGAVVAELFTRVSDGGDSVATVFSGGWDLEFKRIVQGGGV